MPEQSRSFASLFDSLRETDEYWTERAIHEFTEELARWMKIRQLTQVEFARRVGTSQPYITKVLRGNANFTLASMVKLARSLGVEFRSHLAPAGSYTTWRAWDVLNSERASCKIEGEVHEVDIKTNQSDSATAVLEFDSLRASNG